MCALHPALPSEEFLVQGKNNSRQANKCLSEYCEPSHWLEAHPEVCRPIQTRGVSILFAFPNSAQTLLSPRLTPMALSHFLLQAIPSPGESVSGFLICWAAPISNPRPAGPAPVLDRPPEGSSGSIYMKRARSQSLTVRPTVLLVPNKLVDEAALPLCPRWHGLSFGKPQVKFSYPATWTDLACSLQPLWQCFDKCCFGQEAMLCLCLMHPRPSSLPGLMWISRRAGQYRSESH